MHSSCLPEASSEWRIAKIPGSHGPELPSQNDHVERRLPRQQRRSYAPRPDDCDYLIHAPLPKEPDSANLWRILLFVLFAYSLETCLARCKGSFRDYRCMCASAFVPTRHALVLQTRKVASAALGPLLLRVDHIVKIAGQGFTWLQKKSSDRHHTKR
jgi:hypothetical protein